MKVTVLMVESVLPALSASRTAALSFSKQVDGQSPSTVLFLPIVRIPVTTPTARLAAPTPPITKPAVRAPSLLGGGGGVTIGGGATVDGGAATDIPGVTVISRRSPSPRRSV